MYERMDALLAELQIMIDAFEADPAHTDVGQLIGLITTAGSQLQAICDGILDQTERRILDAAPSRVDKAQRGIQNSCQAQAELFIETVADANLPVLRTQMQAKRYIGARVIR